MAPDFRAYLIEAGAGGKGAGRLGRWAVADLDAGEVLIRVHFSSINYKDALAATGTGKIIRRYPCIGGIDLSGEVVESADPLSASSSGSSSTERRRRFRSRRSARATSR